MIEGYFGLALSTCIQLRAMMMCTSIEEFKFMHFSMSGDICSTIFTFIAVPMLLVIPIIPHKLKYKHSDKEKMEFI